MSTSGKSIAAAVLKWFSGLWPAGDGVPNRSTCMCGLRAGVVCSGFGSVVGTEALVC